ncbi:DUF2293 domain-containing protein [Puniceicoccus vermicola]|uniref:DUF2293 domain-containing protein n=1 Tax=Puniceicoccus vermicola TaxID=388746 RepID=A0A7X1AXL2_9BACT|nr:DUF2293 domain-containing protein [Puniceicoccus vermicola]MBC2601831.1 DUF2293 domain-containing protein [Puniceicoccus vermicola]
MPETIEVRPSPKPRHVFTVQGNLLAVPAGWELLPPGDAALSRRIKADGPHWIVKEKKGRKVFSRGIWAPAKRIEALRLALETERADPAYTRKLEQSRARRARQESAYQEDFKQALIDYLGFHPRYELLAKRLADLIGNHATPVGSGTVARTQRIPIEKRAEAATIAWLRHQTTAYDHMHIPRQKGARREVRRMLAQESKCLLAGYRQGTRIDVENCPLQKALQTSDR